MSVGKGKKTQEAKEKARCPECWPPKASDPDERRSLQLKRHIHWLKLSSNEDALRGHLKENFVDESSSPDIRQRDEAYVQSCMSWVHTIRQEYGQMRLADEATGAELPVWKAWVLSNQGKKVVKVDDKEGKRPLWNAVQEALPHHPAA